MATDDLTEMLRVGQFEDGRNHDRWDRILATVYEDVRILARRHLRGEVRNITLQTTIIAHDAIERVILKGRSRFESRQHFYGAISVAIRRCLVDYARARRTARRGGGQRPVSIHDLEHSLPEPGSHNGNHDRLLDILAVEEVLSRLEAFAPQQAKLVELRYFTGLSVEEVSEVLGISVSSVERQWRVARAWLLRQLADEPPEDGTA